MNTETNNFSKSHTFKIPYDEQYSPAEISMTLQPEASLYEVIDVFKMFLLSTGYVFPENTTLGFVEDEEGSYVRVYNDK